MALSVRSGSFLQRPQDRWQFKRHPLVSASTQLGVPKFRNIILKTYTETNNILLTYTTEISSAVVYQGIKTVVFHQPFHCGELGRALFVTAELLSDALAL
jgi:hypothetical protein